VLGIALKLGPAAKPVLWAGFIGLSLFGVLALYGLLRALRVSRRVSVCVAFVYAVSPAVVLYENWLFYTMPTAVGSTVVAAMLARLIRRPRARDALVLVAVATALAWTWGIFHLVWLAGLIVFAVLRTRRARRVVVAGAVAFVATLAMYGKNAAVGGHFSPSSWEGMNLYRVASAEVPRDEVIRVVDRAGVPRTVLRGPFSPISAYRTKTLYDDCPRGAHRAKCAEKKPGGHLNYNHIGYAKLSTDYGRAARALIVAHPGAYADSVRVAATRFWDPPADFSFVRPNRKHIERYADAFTLFPNLAFGEPTGLPTDGRDKITRRVSWAPLGLMTVAAVAALVRTARRSTSRRRRGEVAPGPLLAFGWFFLASSLFELGENERFQFTVEPLIFALGTWAIAVVAGGVARWAASAFRVRSGAPGSK
jgi:hypothetical protein